MNLIGKLRMNPPLVLTLALFRWSKKILILIILRAADLLCSNYEKQKELITKPQRAA